MRYLFFFSVGVFFLSGINSQAMPAQAVSLQDALTDRYTEKIIEDHPMVVSRSIAVVFFNEQELKYPKNTSTSRCKCISCSSSSSYDAES